MGRKSHSRSLDIWANGLRVGRWTLSARGDATLQYDPQWVASDAGRPLSLSLPFTLDNRPLRGPAVAHYFDNLLPDSDPIRKRVAERFHLGSTDPFDLLQAIGRDCVGAVQLLAEDGEPEGVDTVQAQPLSEKDIERHLLESVSPPRFGAARESDDNFRISLAGAQEKAAFLRWEDRWCQPRGSTPTTHIFKLPLGRVGGRQADFSTSVDNEWLCLRLMKAYGLDVAEASIERFGSQRVLVVQRFDRRPAPGAGWILRLPQEDFCQVLGVSPLRKYENQGGPGLKALFSTLQQSERAEEDMRTLLTTQVLFWLMCAPDGHAKNFSIHLLPQGRFRLTKLYDVMSGYPVLGDGPDQWSPHEVSLAMALSGRNRHYRIRDIRRRHFNSTARLLGYADSAEPIVQQVIERTPAAIAQVHAELPPDIDPAVVDAILGGVQKAAHALQAMGPTD